MTDDRREGEAEREDAPRLDKETLKDLEADDPAAQDVQGGGASANRDCAYGGSI